MSVVARNGYPVLLGDGESVDRRVGSDGRQGSAHVLQVPHSNRPVVRTGNHFVRPGEHSRGNGLGVTLSIRSRLRVNKKQK